MSIQPLPLQGVRVADFGQVIAAPVTAQMLGWLGAEVILVETESRFTTRVWPPFADGEFGINQSGGFNLVNNNKLSCSLDLSKPDALEIARGIIGVSDVLVENYATGAMERLGLGYDEVRKLRPDIVYMSLGAFGRSGPFKDLTGFHSVINLFSGLAAVAGYPDSHPRIMGGLIPDAFAGCYCVLAVLEALYHRSRTGEGQYIEVSMTEALTGMIPGAVMEYSLTGKEHERGWAIAMDAIHPTMYSVVWARKSGWRFPLGQTSSSGAWHMLAATQAGPTIRGLPLPRHASRTRTRWKG